MIPGASSESYHIGPPILLQVRGTDSGVVIHWVAEEGVLRELLGLESGGGDEEWIEQALSEELPSLCRVQLEAQLASGVLGRVVRHENFGPDNDEPSLEFDQVFVSEDPLKSVSVEWLAFSRMPERERSIEVLFELGADFLFETLTPARTSCSWADNTQGAHPLTTIEKSADSSPPSPPDELGLISTTLLAGLLLIALAVTLRAVRRR